MATTPDIPEIHTRLRTFVGNEMERDEHHACVKLELLYLPPGEYRREPIKSWHRQSEVDKPYFDAKGSGHVAYLDRLVTEMIELAEYHADGIGSGKQKFKVVSHHAMGGGRHVHNFVMVPSGEPSEASDAELVPSDGGIKLQLMRHLENQQRLNKDMMQSFGAAMRDVVMQMREEREADRNLIRQMEKDRREGFAEIEAARSKAHDQQIEAQLVVSETENKTFATKKIFGLLPVAISRFLEGSDEDREDRESRKSGGKNGHGKDKDGKPKPWKPSALSVALGELAESITDDQQDVIERALDIEQKIMLSEAIRLAKKGGAVMLPQIVHDLAAGMKQDQLAAILKAFSGDQQQKFVRALQLAKAEVEPATDTATKKSAGDTAPPPNGATATP